MNYWKCPVCGQANHYDVTACVACHVERDASEDERQEARDERKARELWLRLWDNGRDVTEGFAPGDVRARVADFLWYLLGSTGDGSQFNEAVNDGADSHVGEADRRPPDYFGPALPK